MNRLTRRSRQRDDGEVAIGIRLMTAAQARRLLARHPASNESFARGYPSDGDFEAATTFLREITRGKDPGPFGPYEVLLGPTVIVGGIGFHHPPDVQGLVEVGYGIAEDQRNKGYATQALTALIGVARELGVRCVEARAEPANLASRRVMEKAGLTYDGLVHGLVVYRLSLQPAERPALKR